ncbi:NUDIX hydrolase [Streptosporangium sp. NPDC006007]|uniref:NUDIX hydrolase n=1 Tax=Streptosporangium sp. NPDC006007 TaxID=3154575 RepID=UPI0033AA91A0
MTIEEYRHSLARHPAASALLITDEAGRVLLVRPTYKDDGWEFPGGAVDDGETPWEGAVREIKEELGIAPLASPALLCADWMRPHDDEPGGFRLVFDGGVMTQRELEAIQLPPEELSEWKLVDPTDADAFLPSVRVRRLHACVSARRTGRTAYLEDGHPLS